MSRNKKKDVIEEKVQNKGGLFQKTYYLYFVLEIFAGIVLIIGSLHWLNIMQSFNQETHIQMVFAYLGLFALMAIKGFEIIGKAFVTLDKEKGE